MDNEYMHKLDRVRNLLLGTGGVAIAYSGGVDSSLVLAIAREVLDRAVLAVISTSSIHPRFENNAAIEWLKCNSVNHVAISTDELHNPDFLSNTVNRCFYCKKKLFTEVWKEALARGFNAVADGANADDELYDDRPGIKAAKEASVISPLLEAGLGKSEIRLIARDVYGLTVWDKPSMACLASRIPYGSCITPEKLRQVECVEEFLISRGFEIYRARHHDIILRLELGEREMKMILDPVLRRDCIKFAKEQGFKFVSVDIEGYRTGSQNNIY